MADLSPLQNVLDFVVLHQGIVIIVLALPPALLAYEYRRSLGAFLAKLPASHGAIGFPLGSLSDHFYGVLGNFLGLILALVGVLLAVKRPVSPTVGLTALTTACAHPGDDAVILFIHGWNGDPQGTWRQFPALACTDARLSSTAVIVVNYPTFMLRRNLRIAQIADFLQRSIEADPEWSKYRKVGVVAHSMGGLVAREMSLLETLSGRASRPVILIEMATPHEGANLARLAAALGIAEEQTEELRGGSSFLATLQTQWTQLTNRPKTSCFVGIHDVVVSEASALADCDQKLSFPEWGHTEVVKPMALSDTRYALPMSDVLNSLTAPR